MKYFILVLSLLAGLYGCAIEPSIEHQYDLTRYSATRYTHTTPSKSLLVAVINTAKAYDSTQMLYVKHPFELAAFAHNSWIAPPADMLKPLLLQSAQYSGYFTAVTANAAAEKTDYRLDTELLALYQDFITKPSTLVLEAKITLADVKHLRILGSKLLKFRFRCPTDTPFGGTLAANNAAHEFTTKTMQFLGFYMRHA
ncbi:MAG: hypothetical protein CMF38_03015 [Legionellaceae bacterium]|nr:hypothetical protein [Legionellaceae bacterium]HCA90286.1 hypothetical protein [Legionellales bacterium]|tara:strand:- start:678 stop:1271 length:594 start_codon:yes stop_codon:yes gene_type:complete